jgi:uncharacterized protein (TIRG00374 family)
VTDVADPETVGAAEDQMPDELSSSHLRARLLQLTVLLVIVALAIWLTPGLGSLRKRLDHAAAGWLVVAAVAELLSALSYVVIFRSVFCVRMPWRLSYKIGMAEQAANSLLPAGGAGGLALGAWALSKGGMKAEHIARRTVAFFVLTSLPNFLTLILFAIGFATGVFGGNTVPGFTYGFALAAVIGIVLVLAVPLVRRRFPDRHDPHGHAKRAKALANRAIDILADGVLDSLWLLRTRPLGVLTGAIGYMAFDIVALGACFEAFGYTPAIAVLVVAYLIGQLGGLLPLPGGIGGIELGLVGTFAVYDVPVSASAAAVLGYRVLQLWIPAALGAVAFVQLRDLFRGKREEAATMCEPLAEPIQTELIPHHAARTSRSVERPERAPASN